MLPLVKQITFMKKVAKTQEIVMTQVAENSATIKPNKSRRKYTLRSYIPLTCERRNVHTTSSGTQTSGNLDSIFLGKRGT